MSVTIDCSTCLRQQSSGCEDCVVMFLTSREPDEAVVVDAAEFAALRRLADAGLVPELRHDDGSEVEADQQEAGSARILHWRSAG